MTAFEFNNQIAGKSRLEIYVQIPTSFTHSLVAGMHYVVAVLKSVRALSGLDFEDTGSRRSDLQFISASLACLRVHFDDTYQDLEPAVVTVLCRSLYDYRHKCNALERCLIQLGKLRLEASKDRRPVSKVPSFSPVLDRCPSSPGHSAVIRYMPL